MRLHFYIFACALLLLMGLPNVRGQAQTGTLTVHLKKSGVPISPTFYGLMTEEINHSYDGGLYAELIQNRAFQDDPALPVHWAPVASAGASAGASGTMALDKDKPLSTARPVSLRLDIVTAGKGQRVGVANDGFWGVPVRPHTVYNASFYARADSRFAGPVTITLESSDGTKVAARAAVPQVGTQWRQYHVVLRTGAVPASEGNRFVLSAGTPGTVWLTQVSLMPPTFHGRANGNRPDLMQKMAAMRPAFLRLPGGNYLEGNTVAERFDWKRTLGAPAQRPGHQGPWGYRSSDGTGLLEFLEWCEDLHVQPVLAVFAGYALQGEYVPAGPKLQPFVQDALDEIEYVTGGPNTKWGARRVQDGHPAPFSLKYVEVGNEDWFDKSGSYDGRFAQFYDALRARYPKLQIIATTGVKSRVPDVQDDHYYRSPAAMARDASHYDGYSRTGPKIFVGEWASQDGQPTPTLNAALGDAAWLTGLERNSDLVVMECYAPLFVNVNPNGRQWGTNLIGYDALHSFGSPSYYVQTMFGQNTGNRTVPANIAPAPSAPAPAPVPHGGIGVGTWDTEAEFRNVSVTQDSKSLYQKDFAAGAADWTLLSGQWQATDGVLRETADGNNNLATAGDPAWTDYTYHLQARKITGREGFLILFHVHDADHYLQWNLGGWGNTRTALQRVGDDGGEISASAPVTIETGRWYDIRVEVQGQRVRGYLDNVLVTDATDVPSPPASPLYVAASRVSATGEVVLKVVNMSAQAQALRIAFEGAQSVSPNATGTVLTGSLEDVNTIANPTKVAPHAATITNAGRTFNHTFPAQSVSVWRFHVRE